MTGAGFLEQQKFPPDRPGGGGRAACGRARRRWCWSRTPSDRSDQAPNDDTRSSIPRPGSARGSAAPVDRIEPPPPGRRRSPRADVIRSRDRQAHVDDRRSPRDAICRRDRHRHRSATTLPICRRCASSAVRSALRRRSQPPYPTVRGARPARRPGAAPGDDRRRRPGQGGPAARRDQRRLLARHRASRALALALPAGHASTAVRSRAARS